MALLSPAAAALRNALPGSADWPAAYAFPCPHLVPNDVRHFPSMGFILFRRVDFTRQFTEHVLVGQDLRLHLGKESPWYMAVCAPCTDARGILEMFRLLVLMIIGLHGMAGYTKLGGVRITQRSIEGYPEQNTQDKNRQKYQFLVLQDIIFSTYTPSAGPVAPWPVIFLTVPPLVCRPPVDAGIPAHPYYGRSIYWLALAILYLR